jgi:hypothetical protein
MSRFEEWSLHLGREGSSSRVSSASFFPQVFHSDIGARIRDQRRWKSASHWQDWGQNAHYALVGHKRLRLHPGGCQCCHGGIRERRAATASILEGEAADSQYLVLPALNPGCGLALTVFGLLSVRASCGPCVDLANPRAAHDEEDRNSSGASL